MFTTNLVLPTPAPLKSPKTASSKSSVSPVVNSTSSFPFINDGNVPQNQPYGAHSPFQHDHVSNGNGTHNYNKQPPQKASKQNYQNDSVSDTLTDIDEAISEFNSANPSFDNVNINSAPPNNQQNSAQVKPQENRTLPYSDIYSWSPQMVQEYFQSRGYEPNVCACFLRHKISGSILLELDLAYLKEIDITSFGTRFEISKEIKQLNQMLRTSTASAGQPNSNINSIHKTNSIPSYSQTPVSHAQPLRSSLSSDSPHSVNTLMSPPTFKRQSVLRTSKDNSYVNTYLATTPATSPFQNQKSPKTPGSNGDAIKDEYQNRESNSHKKDPSFDPNWVHPATLKKQQEVFEQQQNQITYNFPNSQDSGYSEPQADIQTPKAQVRGRFRSSTISTTDQYFHDYQASPDIPSVPTHNSLQFQNGHHRNSFSGSSKGGHSRKSSYVEDTRLRHNTHSRQSSYDTIRGTGAQDGPQFKGPKHSRSASSLGLSEFKFLKPYTNGNLPDSFMENEEDSADMNTRRRSSIMASLVKPLPLIKKDLDTLPLTPEDESPLRDGSILTEKRIGTDPTMNRTPTSTSTDSSTLQSTSDDGKKKPMMRSASSHNNIRTKGGAFSSSKQKTSAFQEGINEITPAGAAKTADFSGWMSKRGSLAVGTWKSRFFTLHGTRLSYFTSFSDNRERGLIDITSHRVLPVGESDDRFVALYAASVGAGRHCFKVVPPTPGTRKGVTFTMPKVHYFAVDTREEMRAWMAALMKATIDRDDTVPIISSCVTPTIPLNKAQEMQAEARAKEDYFRSQAISATNVGEPNGVANSNNSTWLSGFGFTTGGDPSTPDSPTNSSSLRSSKTGSSNTESSANRSTKGGSPPEYFNQNAAVPMDNATAIS